jgi:hypothetical protein
MIRIISESPGLLAAITANINNNIVIHFHKKSKAYESINHPTSIEVLYHTKSMERYTISATVKEYQGRHEVSNYRFKLPVADIRRPSKRRTSKTYPSVAELLGDDSESPRSPDILKENKHIESVHPFDCPFFHSY